MEPETPQSPPQKPADAGAEPRILPGPGTTARGSTEPAADYESTPLTRAEYISAIVHLYRGELHRANSWRIRLDNTTNWAVLTVAGLLSLSFSEGTHSHWILLVGMAIITVFLTFEARRFRMADVWRGRVRKIEENFYGPILRRDPVSPQKGWGNMVAMDLFDPHFKISRAASLRIRFTRNYWAIYGVLLFSWVMQVLQGPEPPDSWAALKQKLAVGELLPWWTPFCYIGLFVLGFTCLLAFTPRLSFKELEYWKGQDEARANESLIDL